MSTYLKLAASLLLALSWALLWNDDFAQAKDKDKKKPASTANKKDAGAKGKHAGGKKGEGKSGQGQKGHGKKGAGKKSHAKKGSGKKGEGKKGHGNKAAGKKQSSQKSHGKKGHVIGKSKGHTAAGKSDYGPDDIRPDVLARLMRDNPGLPRNFIRTAAPDQKIKLPNGQTYPVYQLSQFLHHNFRMNLKAAKKEGEELVQEQNWKMHRLMARPEFRDWFKSYHPTYKVNGKKVGWHEAYGFVRGLHNTVQVSVGPKGRMPYGGGGRAVAPSWAVWKKLNLLYHEAANATKGFSGDDPVLTGVLAGHLQKMEKHKLWNYPTIDVNTLAVSHLAPPNPGADKPVKHSKHHKTAKKK